MSIIVTLLPDYKFMPPTSVDILDKIPSGDGINIVCTSVIASRNEWPLMSTNHGQVGVDDRLSGDEQQVEEYVCNTDRLSFNLY